MRTSSASIWRLLVTITVLGAAAAFIYFGQPNLGIDLRGGTQITLQTESTNSVKANADSTDRTVEVLRGRINSLGVSESTIVRSGSDRIIVELPDVQDPTKAKQVLGQTATLEFRQVLGPVLDPSAPLAEGQMTYQDPNSPFPVLLSAPALTGDGVKDAQATVAQDAGNNWEVDVNFNKKGATDWTNLVTAACTTSNPQIAIVLDGQVISAPTIQSDMCIGGGGDSTRITYFSQADAQNLAVLIKGGALPLTVKIIDTSTIGPTLGADAIHASIWASIIGLALTAAFIIFNYRGVGVMATIALGCYAVIAYGALIAVGATLTLPGLAGFVLAIGLAIDANVLVYERAREEYHEHPKTGLRPALDTGFAKAWSAIIDSNVTTILAAMLLFFLASGAVKGFGVTLTIGVLASMISALVIARLLTDWFVSLKMTRKHPAISGIAGISRVRKWLNEHGPYLVRFAGRLVVGSLAVAAIMIGGIAVRGLNLGVDFAGGTQIEIPTATAVNPDEARKAISDAGFPDAVVQKSSSDGKDNITVRVHKVSDADIALIEEAVYSLGGNPTPSASDATVTPEPTADTTTTPTATTDQTTPTTGQLPTVRTVDASLGTEMRNKALLAFLIAIVAQMSYLAWRFRWTWAAAAIVSMASVVLAVVGIFAWWGKTIDGVFLAAILSVIGLSVNDTIVVFDRVRERLASGAAGTVRELTNEAILSTIPRTINTALGATFILSSLVILGGDSLRDFSIAVLLGLIIGHLSTVFTAAPLGVLLEERWPHLPSKKRVSVDPYDFVRAE